MHLTLRNKCQVRVLTDFVRNAPKYKVNLIFKQFPLTLTLLICTHPSIVCHIYIYVCVCDLKICVFSHFNVSEMRMWLTIERILGLCPRYIDSISP